MKPKYSPEYKIEKKYNHRKVIINTIENLGIIAGFAYGAIAPLADVAQDSWDMNSLYKLGVGALTMLISYFGGNFLRKRNEKRKQKALDNLVQTNELSSQTQ